MKKVNRYTRAREDGKRIQCPDCQAQCVVYHFNWLALTCPSCGVMQPLKEWLLVDLPRKLYVVKGNVRGQCAHQHRSLAGAVQCLLRDRVGARKQGGYSDREICYQDGRKLDESDYVDAMTIEARITDR